MTASNRVCLFFWLLGLSLSTENALPQTPVFRNTQPGVRYLGSQVCASCHADIFASYRNTSMGRSMVSGGDASVLDRFPAPFTVFDSDSGEYFEVLRKQDGLYQSEYAVDRKAREVFRQTRKLTYVVGAGENGFGFLVQRGNYLFEAPLTYYSEPRIWSFSPGYEQRNLGFSRPVLAECIACHAGRPQPIYDSAGLYADPPFAELAIGCENCHGPGELHVSERRAGRALRGGLDTSIVNPRNLSGWLSDNICMQCHQGGDVRVERTGKHIQDFRPGTPLNQVLSIFKAPDSGNSAEQSVLLEHYFSMTVSKCFRSSVGKLRCTTCHNPHIQPSLAESASYYRAKCLSCHQPDGCKLPSAERAKTNPSDNCVLCHMPGQTVTTITHAALTSHRIAARADEPLPDAALRAASNSGLIDLTAVPGNRSTPDAVTLLQAYVTAIRSGHNEFKPKLDALLDGLAADSSANAFVLSALGRRALTIEKPDGAEQAIRYFKAAIRKDPGAYENYILLASVYARRAQHREATQALLAGMPANPYVREFPESLAVQYMEMGKYADALRVLADALNVFPEDVKLRTLQNKAASATLDGTLTPSH